MLILSLCYGGHDSSAVVADDYEILAAVQTERVTRNKGEGIYAHLAHLTAHIARIYALPKLPPLSA